MKKRILISALTLSIIGSHLSFNTPVMADELDDLNTKVEKNKKEKNQLENKKEKINNEINNTEDKISSLNNKIEQYEIRIASTKMIIDKISNDVIVKEREIKVLEKELDSKKEILARNLQIIHQKGDTKLLELLFSSENFSELLTRFTTLKDIANANENLYQEVRKQKEKVEIKKAELEKQKEQQELKKKSLDDLRNKQQEAKKEQQKLLNELEKEHSHIEQEINEQDAAIFTINNQIADVIRKREEARKAAEAARLKAEAEKANFKPIVSEQHLSYNSSDLVGNGWSNPMKSGTYYVSSEYGWRSHPISGSKRLHGGIDLAAPLGTPIYAAASGTVLYAGPASGFGNWVVIDHNNGYYTIYGHMYGNQIFVSPGQQVSQGQHIAGVGSAGGSTGNHLHVEWAKGSLSNKINPRNFISF